MKTYEDVKRVIQDAQYMNLYLRPTIRDGEIRMEIQLDGIFDKEIDGEFLELEDLPLMWECFNTLNSLLGISSQMIVEVFFSAMKRNKRPSYRFYELIAGNKELVHLFNSCNRNGPEEIQNHETTVTAVCLDSPTAACCGE